MARTIRSKVSGVTFDNRQKIIKKYCREGTQLIAIHEPRNRHSPDRTAVGLWVEAGWRKVQVGYIRDGLSSDICKHLKTGGSVNVQVSEVTGGTSDCPTRGVNIEIELIPAEAKQAEAARPTPKPKPAPPPQPAPAWNTGDRLYVAGEYSKRLAGAAGRGLVAGYRGLPDWAQPIAWGLGAATILVVSAILLRFLR